MIYYECDICHQRVNPKVKDFYIVRSFMNLRPGVNHVCSKCKKILMKEQEKHIKNILNKPGI